MVLTTIVALVTATAASPVSCPLSSCPGFPILVPVFGARVSPNKLPKNDYVPIIANVFGKVATSDGTHPPALREAVVDIDKDIRVHVKGFPVCSAHIGVRDDGTMLERLCRSSLIGRGRAQLEIAFPEVEPIKFTRPLFVLNRGEESGEITLAIVTSVTVPAPATIVTTVTITRKGGGVHAVAKVPVVAGGDGSLLGFNFKLGKTYEYKGRTLGYLEGRCPDSVFKLDVPSLVFKNEAHTPGQEASSNLKGKLAVPCTPKG